MKRESSGVMSDVPPHLRQFFHWNVLRLTPGCVSALWTCVRTMQQFPWSNQLRRTWSIADFLSGGAYSESRRRISKKIRPRTFLCTPIFTSPTLDSGDEPLRDPHERRLPRRSVDAMLGQRRTERHREWREGHGRLSLPPPRQVPANITLTSP